MMVTIVRLTARKADKAQLAELRRLFGKDTLVVQVPTRVSGAAQLREIVFENFADVLEVGWLPVCTLADCVGPSGVGVPIIVAAVDRVPVKGNLFSDVLSRFTDAFSRFQPVEGPLYEDVFSHYRVVEYVENTIVATRRLCQSRGRQTKIGRRGKGKK